MGTLDERRSRVAARLLAFVGSAQPSMMRSSRCGTRTVQQLPIRDSFAFRGTLYSIGLDRWVLNLIR